MPLQGGGEQQGGEQRQSRGAPLGSRAWGSGTRMASVPPSLRSPRFEGRGKGARQKPKPRGPSLRAPLPAQPPPAPATGAHSCPPLATSPAAAKFSLGLWNVDSLPQVPRAARPPPTRPRALTLPSPKVAAKAVPSGSPCPRQESGHSGYDPQRAGASGRLPARSALITAHTPGEVAGEPLAATPAEPANLERRGGRAGVGVRRHPHPRPQSCALRSPFMPGSRSSASADTCWSHLRPVFV